MQCIVDFKVPGLTTATTALAWCLGPDNVTVVDTTGWTLTLPNGVDEGQYILTVPLAPYGSTFKIYEIANTANYSLGSLTMSLEISSSYPAAALTICNNAILALGGNVVTSFADSTAEGILCTNLWPPALDAVLRLHPWNCAIKRAVLAPDVTPPTYEWTAAFTLPADLLRILDLDEVTEYKVEGRKILCDESALNIRYVYRNEVVNTWDSLLVSVLTAYMAFKFAYPLTKSNSTRDTQWKLFTELLRTAKAIDAQEEPGDTIGDFPFINVRG
jgi:hypothetical protein